MCRKLDSINGWILVKTKQSQGYSHFFIKVWRRVSTYLTYCLSLPLAFFFILLFPFVRVRFLCLFSDRIGHYSLNTERLLCILKESHYSKRDIFLFYIRDAPICNLQLHVMWRRIIHIIPFARLCAQLDQVMLLVLKGRYKNNVLRALETPFGGQDNNGLLVKHEPHLSFTSGEHQRGKSLMKELGLPEGACFICLSVRDSAYLSKVFPDSDWSYHNCRDSNILNYEKAALYLAELGYYVIRMGKFVQSEFSLSHSNIIDYANHRLRSDFLDIYLSAHCHFFISTSTGLDGVPQVFRRPILITDLFPASGQIQYWFPFKLFLTKMIKHQKNGDYLTFSEINTIFSGQSSVERLLKEHNLEIQANTQEELLDIVDEMVKRVNNTWRETDEDAALQASLLNAFPVCLIQGGNQAMPAKEQLKIRMGSRFLKQYKLELLQEVAEYVS